jgi:hypothetical protein
MRSFLKIEVMYRKILQSPFLEAGIWGMALLYLFFMNPFEDSTVSLCILKNIGFEHCPGCGLGRSISFLLHGELSSSWGAHKFAIPTLLILTYRIIQIIVNYYRHNRQKVSYKTSTNEL